MKIANVLSLTLLAGLAFCLVGCGGAEKPEQGDGGADAAKDAGKVAVVNAKCPMMGNKINQAAMAPDMTRDYNGQKVGFCCPSCMPKWDALSEEDKEAKLAAAMTP